MCLTLARLGRFAAVLLVSLYGLAAADQPAEWRAWQVSDGLRESYTPVVTLDPAGRVIARHGQVGSFSLLDGYRVRSLPSPGGSAKIHGTREGVLWVLGQAGLREFREGRWFDHPLEPLRRAA
ncbi:MAG: hypothetical protein ACPL88_13040, partial [Bryobacteraceae bacterium]